MKNILKLTYITLALSTLTFTACNKDDDEIDTEKPTIDISFAKAFPQNGSELHFGESFTLNIRLADNMELGAYSVNIHSNFDHHSHSTEEEEEHHHEEGEEHHHHEEGEGDGFFFTQDYAIPAGLKEYNVTNTIEIPAHAPDGDEYQGGDYHFMITVTDKAGFSVFKSVEIHIHDEDNEEHEHHDEH